MAIQVGFLLCFFGFNFTFQKRSLFIPFFFWKSIVFPLCYCLMLLTLVVLIIVVCFFRVSELHTQC